MIERLNEVICIAPWLELDLGGVIAGRKKSSMKGGKENKTNKSEQVTILEMKEPR